MIFYAKVKPSSELLQSSDLLPGLLTSLALEPAGRRNSYDFILLPSLLSSSCKMEQCSGPWAA